MHVAEVPAKETVEFFIIITVKIVPVPPEPIAPFGGVDLLPSLLPILGGKCRHVLGSSLQKGAGPPQAFPSLIVFRGADPDPEILFNPGAGMQSIQVFLRRIGFQEFPDFDRWQHGLPREALIKNAQKISSSVWIVLPRVLAVKGNKSQSVFASPGNRVLDVLQMSEEVIRRRLGRVFPVCETD
jgi:hypothetical protein